MNVVISDPKTGKAYPKKVDDESAFFDKKIGDTISLDSIGLADYEAVITGGSDSDGFPMKRYFAGTRRNKNFVTKNKKEGLRIKVTERGNTIANDIAQVNLKITKYGGKKIDEMIVVDKKEKKTSAKEELVEASLKAAGTTEAAKEMETAEFKKGEKNK
ncbi:MAG: S6e family ribosomal protein [archaeon]